MRDLRKDPLIVRGEVGVEVVEPAVIVGHKRYDGDFELRVGPGTPGSPGGADGTDGVR